MPSNYKLLIRGFSTFNVTSATSTIVSASRTYAQDQVKNTTAEKDAVGEQIAKQFCPEEQACKNNEYSAEG